MQLYKSSTNFKNQSIKSNFEPGRPLVQDHMSKCIVAM